MPRNGSKPTPVRRYRSRLRPLGGLPDLTALIDVLFLTLIFFMISSSFVQVSGIRVDLPRVSNPSSAVVEKFVLSMVVDPQKKIRMYFNDQPVDQEALKQQFAAAALLSRDATVVIRASGDVPHEAQAQVMALAENARLSTFWVTAPAVSKSTSFGQ